MSTLQIIFLVLAAIEIVFNLVMIIKEEKMVYLNALLGWLCAFVWCINI